MADDGVNVVAGAQLLVRPLSWLGSVGYVPKGPVIAAPDAQVSQAVVEALLDLAATHRVRYLVVQPASVDAVLDERLLSAGFKPVAKLGAASATLRIDLSRPIDELLADMNASTRRNIKRGLSYGITVRHGADVDVHLFSRLMEAGSERKRFALPVPGYYAAMWRILRSPGHIGLLIGEHQGEAVCAMLTIGFGDTVFAHASAWTGKHAEGRPNQVLEWAAITWAKEHGYKFFDVEGIDGGVAHALREFGSAAARLEGQPFHAVQARVRRRNHSVI